MFSSELSLCQKGSNVATYIECYDITSILHRNVLHNIDLNRPTVLEFLERSRFVARNPQGLIEPD